MIIDDDQAFYDTIEESADKLWLHTNELAGKSLKKVLSLSSLSILSLSSLLGPRDVGFISYRGKY